jgi:hypothetical protein
MAKAASESVNWIEGLFDVTVKGFIQNTKQAVTIDYAVCKCTLDFIEQPYFMVLDNKTYSVSTGVVPTNPDGLQTILLILRKFKHILNTELAV